MGVSWNGGTPKSSILMGLSIINHPFGGTTIYGNPYILQGKNTLLFPVDLAWNQSIDIWIADFMMKLYHKQFPWGGDQRCHCIDRWSYKLSWPIRYQLPDLLCLQWRSFGRPKGSVLRTRIYIYTYNIYYIHIYIYIHTPSTTYIKINGRDHWATTLLTNRIQQE